MSTIKLSQPSEESHLPECSGDIKAVEGTDGFLGGGGYGVVQKFTGVKSPQGGGEYGPAHEMAGKLFVQLVQQAVFADPSLRSLTACLAELQS